MKRNIVIFVLLLGCLTMMCIGCASTEEQHRCVKCGGIATTTLSGPAEILQKNGISISDCEQITSNVYSAYVCDSCVGPVAHPVGL